MYASIWLVPAMSSLLDRLGRAAYANYPPRPLLDHTGGAAVCQPEQAWRRCRYSSIGDPWYIDFRLAQVFVNLA